MSQDYRLYAFRLREEEIVLYFAIPGLNLEAVDKGMNGGLVKSVAYQSAVEQDGNIKAGDFVVSINNESLRNCTNSQIRAILRRVSLIGIEFR